MWSKKIILGAKGYLVMSSNGTIIGDFTNNKEEAYRKLLGLMSPESWKVFEVQITDELKTHLCFCKQTHCCCTPPLTY